MGVTIEGRSTEETVGAGWGCYAGTILLYPRPPGDSY